MGGAAVCVFVVLPPIPWPMALLLLYSIRVSLRLLASCSLLTHALSITIYISYKHTQDGVYCGHLARLLAPTSPHYDLDHSFC